MKILSAVKIAILSTFVFLLFPSRAKADLTVCNNSPILAFVATAYPSTEGGWRSEGWYQIASRACQTVLVGNLVTYSPYIYIADNDWQEWDLDTNNNRMNFCVKQSEFSISNPAGECTGNMFPVNFEQIRSSQYNFTIYLD